jgi:hypothetical protein
MKKVLIASAAVALFSGAQAATFVDFDSINRRITGGSVGGYSGAFHVTAPDQDGNDNGAGANQQDVLGYAPGTPIVSAFAEFSFWGDTDNQRETVSIEMTGLFQILWFEITEWQDLGTTPDHITGSYLFSEDLTGAMVANLESDGNISYRLDVHPNSNNNDVTLEWGRLTVVTADTTSRVPDGGATVALLGLGLLGLVGLKRRLAA